MVPYIFCFKFESVLWFYAILYSWLLNLPCIIILFYSFWWCEHKSISKSFIVNVFTINVLFSQKALPFYRIIVFVSSFHFGHVFLFIYFLIVSCTMFSFCVYHVGHVRCLFVTNASLWIRKTMLINIFWHYQYFLFWEHAWPLGSISLLISFQFNFHFLLQTFCNSTLVASSNPSITRYKFWLTILDKVR